MYATQCDKYNLKEIMQPLPVLESFVDAVKRCEKIKTKLTSSEKTVKEMQFGYFIMFGSAPVNIYQTEFTEIVNDVAISIKKHPDIIYKTLYEARRVFLQMFIKTPDAAYLPTQMYPFIPSKLTMLSETMGKKITVNSANFEATHVSKNIIVIVVGDNPKAYYLQLEESVSPTESTIHVVYDKDQAIPSGVRWTEYVEMTLTKHSTLISEAQKYVKGINTLPKFSIVDIESNTMTIIETGHAEINVEDLTFDEKVPPAKKGKGTGNSTTKSTSSKTAPRNSSTPPTPSKAVAADKLKFRKKSDVISSQLQTNPSHDELLEKHDGLLQSGYLPSYVMETLGFIRSGLVYNDKDKKKFVTIDDEPARSEPATYTQDFIKEGDDTVILYETKYPVVTKS